MFKSRPGNFNHRVRDAKRFQGILKFFFETMNYSFLIGWIFVFSLFDPNLYGDTRTNRFGITPVYKITGQIVDGSGKEISGITVTATNGKKSVTDSDGMYSISVASGWTGTISPLSSLYTFTPQSRNYVQVIGNKNGQNFQAVQITPPSSLKISGRIADNSGMGIPGITVYADGTGASAGINTTTTTILDGTYVLNVPYNWSGSVTPQSTSATFSPSTFIFALLPADQSGKDFTALPVQIPFADSASATTPESTPLTLILTGSDSSNRDLTFTITNSPTCGILGPVDNTPQASATVVYTPNPGFIGTDLFRFKVSNGYLDSSEATVTLSVFHINHPPVANSQSVRATAGTPLPITLTGSDPDNDTLFFVLVSPPTGGTLTGTPPNLTYVASASFTGADSFTFKVNDSQLDSPVAPISIDVSPSDGMWVPPLGIPAPSFGINETNAMYAEKIFTYSTGTAPYKDAGNGPYTHYVDNTNLLATDTANPYGSAAKPRKTFPSGLTPGSVVEIHGGPYASGFNITVAGTANQPIFIRGADAVNRPVFKTKISVYASAAYVILENLTVNVNAVTSSVNVAGPAHHIGIRNFDVFNGQSGIIMYGSSTSPLHNVVAYKNTVHDNGNWNNATGDRDYHAFACTQYASYIWIVDNEMYYNEGDGLQVNAGSETLKPYTHHIYAGRNHSHHNKQSGIWTKQAHDVIFSQNTIHGLRPCSSAMGQATGFQYGPDNVWILANNIYDNSIGIMVGASNTTNTNGHYFIGNLVYNCRATKAFNPLDAYHDGQAFVMWGYGPKYVINNTIWDCDGGISFDSGPVCHIVNNIIGNITSPALAILLNTSSTGQASLMQNNLFYGYFALRWGGVSYSTLTALQAATGKGQNCLTADPAFLNPAVYDFHLLSNSPAIDAGCPSDVYTTFYNLYGIDISKDFEGNLRPQGSAFDIGASERKP